MPSREQRRHAERLEARARASGKWGEWEVTYLPHGIPDRNGWCQDVRYVWKNNLYVALVRYLETDWGTMRHAAIRTARNLEPPWRDKQRMKNEIFGEEAVAIEVMPEMSRLVDLADMYHIFVLPEGMRLPFTI